MKNYTIRQSYVEKKIFHQWLRAVISISESRAYAIYREPVRNSMMCIRVRWHPENSLTFLSVCAKDETINSLGNLLNVHLYAKVACLQSFMHLAHRQFPPRLAGAEMRAGHLWCSRSLWDSLPGPIWTQKAKWSGHLHLCSDNCSFAHYGAFWSFVGHFWNMTAWKHSTMHFSCEISWVTRYIIVLIIMCP